MKRRALPEKAIVYFGLAAEQAFKRFAHDEVIHLISKATALLSPHSNPGTI